MPRSPRAPRAITLLAALAGSALALAIWRSRTPAAFVLVDPGVWEGVASEREAAPPGMGRGPDARPYHLSEEHVRKLYRIEETGKVYDPWCYFRERPGRLARIDWPEHPDGYWTLATNSLGFRDDEPGGKPDFEVFVVGDSNAAGVCNQDESFSNRLERLLAGARPEETVSVVNMGTGGYGLFHYLGAVEKCVRSAPDLFVVSVFGGNDFSEALALNRIFVGRAGPLWEAEPGARRREALERFRVPMAHGLNSALLFKHHPHLEGVAVAVALKLAAEMKAACAENGVRLVVLYIPEPFSFPWDPPLEGDAEARGMLDLQPEDLRSSSRIAERFLEGLRALDVPVADLRPVFAALPAPPYWRKDLHMNLEGHELAARALFELIVAE